MKTATIAGIVLIMIGILGIASTGFRFTHEKKDAGLGPIQVEPKRTISISPVLSAIALASGFGLVVVGVRSK